MKTANFTYSHRVPKFWKQKISSVIFRNPYTMGPFVIGSTVLLLFRFSSNFFFKSFQYIIMQKIIYWWFITFPEVILFCGPGLFSVLSSLNFLVFMSHTHPAVVRWTNDQLVTEAATCTTHNIQSRWKQIPFPVFEPEIAAIKLLLTYALTVLSPGSATNDVCQIIAFVSTTVY